MNFKLFSIAIRVVIAVVIGVLLLHFVGFSVALIFAGPIYGLVLFFLFGYPILEKLGFHVSLMFWPDDSQFRIMPEHSVAEARVNQGQYQEAIDEYRKVIARHPDDIYSHLRIADLALKHLNDVKLAELELQSALGKAIGEDTTALAAGRLADLYQHTLHDAGRALEVMKQLREEIPGTKQAKLAEERIALLERLVRGEELPPANPPSKIAIRPSRYKMPE